MKNVLAIAVVCSASLLAAQSPAPGTIAPAAAAPSLNAILTQVQQASQSAITNISRLRIEKWKTDAEQKQQMQHVADSLQQNMSNAVPGLISDVQNSHGNFVSTFKLYHNTNIVYEFLSSLAEAAGAFGKKEEYQPLAADASALDNVRQELSNYIEQSATKLESSNRPAASPTPAAQAVPGKKVVIDDLDPPKKTPSKKSSKAASKKATPTPSPTPPKSQ